MIAKLVLPVLLFVCVSALPVQEQQENIFTEVLHIIPQIGKRNQDININDIVNLFSGVGKQKRPVIDSSAIVNWLANLISGKRSEELDNFDWLGLIKTVAPIAIQLFGKRAEQLDIIDWSSIVTHIQDPLILS